MEPKKVLIVIPARYDSTRLPGKPLVKIAGVEMISRVAAIADHVCQNNDNCLYTVATDDKRILDFCTQNHIPVALTSKECNSGTERCRELTTPAIDLIVNLQGDNPLCPPWFIEELIHAWYKDPEAQVFTPALHLSWQEYDALQEAKRVTPYSGTTVLVDKLGYALAFSKNIIPAVRKADSLRAVLEQSPVRRHIGLYAYTRQALLNYTALEQSPYELCEGLEQMRFLYNHIPVRVVDVDYRGRRSMSGIDSAQDVARAEQIIVECGELF
ncbi:MAG: 3-deoxy-manno-octulosonate cytidylyltransferase [Mucinivorans sp.]